ncbi:MAG: EAL domain-containing protein [Gammaproteobacteria bacterium]|nr:EAL domain-containing protein [Gammaproteobacteria bacterium]
MLTNSLLPIDGGAKRPSLSAAGMRAVDRERMELLCSQGATAMVIGLMVVMVLAAALRGVVDTAWMAAWIAAHVILTLARLTMIARFRRREETGLENLRHWVYAYLAGAALAGLLWASVGLVLDPQWPELKLVMMYVVLTGIMAGAIASNAVIYPVFLAFSLPIIGVIAGWPLVQGSYEHTVFGLVVALLSGFYLVVAYRYNRAIRALIMIRLRNKDLAETLGKRNEEIRAEMLERKRAESVLRRERQLFLGGPVVAFRCRASDGWPIESISPNVIQFGLSFETLVEEAVTLQELIHPDDRGPVARTMTRAFARSGGPFSEVDYRLSLENGKEYWVHCYYVPQFDGTGDVSHFDGYLLDITGVKETEQALAREKERAQVTLHSIGDAVLTTDPNGSVVSMNPVAEDLTGWNQADARSRPVGLIYQVSDESSGAAIDNPLESCLTPEGPWIKSSHLVLHRKDGGSLPIRQTVAAIRPDQDKEPVGATIVFHDMSETRSMARQLEYHASHDALTGLINRREFELRLDHGLLTAREEYKQHICMYLDLDQFKIVNDTCGHVAGDELLRQLSGMLQGQLRGSDTLARLGGDEFGVLLEGCSLEEGSRIANKIRALVREHRFVWEDRTFEIGVSIGIVSIDEQSIDIATVLSQADVACYAAKDMGRNRIHVYEESDEEMSRRHDEIKRVSQITRALEEDRLELYFQEIRPLGHAPSAGLHIEILVRMLDENGGLIRPDDFLPAAERYNLMPAVDRWVVRTTFEWYHRHAMGMNAQCVINLSGTTLSDKEFLAFVRAQFREKKIPPPSICFEITETAAIANLSTATEFMAQLKEFGCKFSLDDFGSGLSSFAYLKSLPVDYLKIDGGFVRDMLTDPVDLTMVSAINEVGQSMGLRTIAEYAESEGIVRELRRLAVDYAQGYGVAKPKPLRLLKLNSGRKRPGRFGARGYRK